MSCAWVLIAVGGCGQKGALYLPDPQPSAVPTDTGTGTRDKTAADGSPRADADSSKNSRDTPHRP